MQKYYVGISLFVLSMLFFSIGYAFLKGASPYFSDTLSLFFVSAFAWLMIAPFVLPKGKEGVQSKRFPFIVLRTVFGLISFLLILYGLRKVSLAEVILLNNTAPLFVPLIVWIWHRAVISLPVWTGLIIGFLGIFLIFNPVFSPLSLGLGAAALSGLFSAGVFVVTRLIAHEPFPRILFYYFLIFVICLSPFLWTDWNWPPTFVWGFLAGSALSLLLAQLTLTVSMRHGHAHDLAPFVYASVVFTGLLDWIFWKDVPNLLSIVGMIVVCIGGSITLLKRKA